MHATVANFQPQYSSPAVPVLLGAALLSPRGLTSRWYWWLTAFHWELYELVTHNYLFVNSFHLPMSLASIRCGVGWRTEPAGADASCLSTDPGLFAEVHYVHLCTDLTASSLLCSMPKPTNLRSMQFRAFQHENNHVEMIQIKLGRKVFEVCVVCVVYVSCFLCLFSILFCAASGQCLHGDTGL